MNTQVLDKKQLEIEMRDKRTEGDLRRRGMSEEDIKKHMEWVRDNRD